MEKKDVQVFSCRMVLNVFCYVACFLTQWQLPDVPFRIFAATAKDGFRKPIPGMWYELERIFKESGVEIGMLLPSRFK